MPITRREHLPGVARARGQTAGRWLAALFLVIAGASLGASDAAPSNEFRLRDRQTSAAALLKAGTLHRDRQLVHLSHVCDIEMKGKHLPIVDLRELVPGASSARGVNRIILLNDKLAPVKTIDYTTQRPLFCSGQRLFVFGDLSVGAGPEGNVLEFIDDGRTVRAYQIEVNKLPAPTSGRMNSLLQ